MTNGTADSDSGNRRSGRVQHRERGTPDRGYFLSRLILRLESLVFVDRGITFTAADDRVVVEGLNRNTARATGRPYEHRWVMLFTIRDGQIARFRHYYDPADITHALE